MTDTLTVSTNALTGMLSTPPNPQTRNITVLAITLWLPGSMAGLFGLVRRNRRRPVPRLRNLWIVAILCLVMGGLTSCGSSSGNTTASPNAAAGTYTIPITLSLAGSATQTVNATVIVQ